MDDPSDCIELLLYGPTAEHGTPELDILQCRAEDTGTLTVSQPVMQAFPLWSMYDPYAQGYDWPASVLTCYRREVAEIGGTTVELRIQSSVTVRVNSQF